MKRLITTFLLLATMVVGIQAKEFNKEQMAIRLSIVKHLAREGYNPKIDKEGDIIFENDGYSYYVIINENWKDPYLITLFINFDYSSGDGKFTRQNVEKCISQIARYKVVKLYCQDNSYSLRSDILCQNGEIFNETFKKLLTSTTAAIDELKEIIEAGTMDVDIIGDKDGAFAKAEKYYSDEDYSKAFPIFKELADHNYVKAYEYVATMYRYGEGTSENKELMAKYYEKAIDAGYNSIANSLGYYYYENEDYEKALQYFLKCGSTENSSRAVALSNAGYIYENGKGVSVDIPMAVQCYRKSVLYDTELESTGRKALIRLNVPVEFESDFVDATKTMLMGMTAKQMYETGLEYENGYNQRTVSLPEAYAFIKAAADRDYIDALEKMGEILISEYYPFNDKAKSDKYYQKAFKKYKQLADHNDGNACNNLGYMYQLGRGVKADKEQAKFYYKKGSMQGDKNATWRFGLICKDELDYAEAFKYFYKAAEDGQGMAMLELAKLYENGIGVSTNKEKAIEWYRKCADSKYKAANDAKEALERLGQK